jgi:tetratricopeptide (TPR) repeat protein
MKHELGLLAFGVAVVLFGCDAPQEVGVRYRAERELWKANREARRLGIQPKLVSPEDWQALAVRFEGIATRYGSTTARRDSSSAARAATEVRQIAARALISAAEVHAAAGDSAPMMQDYQRVVSEFQDLPLMTGEVALVRGRIAASKAHWSEAIAAYQKVVDTVPPDIGGVGVGAAVLDLPLLIARLQVRAAGTAPTAARPAYEVARARYQGWIDAHPGTLIELDSRSHLADLAADLGDWDTAIACLQQLESQLHARPVSGRDPAAVRYGIAMVESRRDSTGEAPRKTLTSLLQDYPKSSSAPRALLLLASDAGRRGQLDEALTDLDRIRNDYADATEIVAQSLLLRGRLLERNRRWPEALETFRSLPVDQPTSDAALQAPLEIVDHYKRANDMAAVNAALAEAEAHYRDFIARYPPGRASVAARVKLVQTLALQKRYEEAVSGLVDLGESMSDRPEGAPFFVDAARMAFNDMKNKPRAAEILERAGKLYPSTEVGRWAVTEASRLREGSTP